MNCLLIADALQELEAPFTSYSMVSETVKPKKLEWLVIAVDYSEPGILKKRLSKHSYVLLSSLFLHQNIAI